MKKLVSVVFLAAAAIGPSAVQSQDTTVITIERWTIFQYGQLAGNLKPLPPGYQHFMPVSAEFAAMRYSSDGCVLCVEQKNAISFGKRLWLGYSPDEAVREIAKLNDDNMLCGYVSGLVLSPVEYAIRGDDKGRKVYVVRWVDQYGRYHYTGIPYRV